MGDKEDKLGMAELEGIQGLFKGIESSEDNEDSLTPIINKTKKRFEKVNDRLIEIEQKLDEFEKSIKSLEDSKIRYWEKIIYVRDTRAKEWYKIPTKLEKTSPPLEALTSKDLAEKEREVPTSDITTKSLK